MLWLLCLVLVSLGLFLLIRRDKNMVLLFNQLPCDIPQWPIIGHLHKFLGNNEYLMQVIQNLGRETTSKGGIMGLWRVNLLYLMVTDADISDYILKHCLEKDDMVKFTWIIIGNASIFAPVSIWRPRRKLLASVFQPKKLNGFVNIFSKQSVTLVEKLKSVAGKGPIPMWDYLLTYSMDALCETTMDIEVNAQKNPNHPFLIAMNELFDMVVSRATKPWLYSDFVLKTLHPKLIEYKKLMYGFIEKIIEEKRKSSDVQGVDVPDYDTKYSRSFIDMMIEISNKGQGCTNLTIQEESILLLLAGVDTTAIGIAFTMVMLSKHPHIQAKVHQELQEVFGDSDRIVATEDLPHLKYLEAVVKETLRLFPPGPFLVRKVDQDLTLPSGITLVRGCSVFINIWAVHRNPRYWGTDAEEFRPERFIEGPLQHPAAFMPFSYGPRGCIGSQYAYMSMKTTIANLVRQFRILPASKSISSQNDPEDLSVKLIYKIMMRDSNNYMVRLENRTSENCC